LRKKGDFKLVEEQKKIERRGYLKAVGAAVAGLAVGGALGWLAKPAEKAVTTETITKTVTAEKPVEKPGKGIRFDYIAQPSGADPVFAAWMQGAKDIADPLGVDVVFRFAEGDTTKLGPWIEEAVSAGTDAIVLVAFDPGTVADPIARAVEKGVPVCMSIIDLPTTKRTHFVGVGDLVKLGKMKAEPLDPYLKEGCYVLACHEELSPRSLTYKQAALDHWEKDLGIHVNIVDLEVTNDLTTAESRITAELTAHPDKYVAILAMGGISTAASNLAEKNAGIPPGKIPITGLDFLDPTIEGIRKGYTIGVICWQPWSSGYLPIANLYPEIKWGLKGAEFIVTGIKLVTKDNLEGFLAHVAEHRW